MHITAKLVQVCTGGFSDETILRGSSGVHILLLKNSTKQLGYRADNLPSNLTCELNAIQEVLKERIILNDINKSNGLVVYCGSKAEIEAITYGHSTLKSEIH